MRSIHVQMYYFEDCDICNHKHDWCLADGVHRIVCKLLGTSFDTVGMFILMILDGLTLAGFRTRGFWKTSREYCQVSLEGYDFARVQYGKTELNLRLSSSRSVRLCFITMRYSSCIGRLRFDKFAALRIRDGSIGIEL